MQFYPKQLDLIWLKFSLQPYPVHVKVPVVQTQYVEKHSKLHDYKTHLMSFAKKLQLILTDLITVDRPVYIEKPTYIEKHVPVAPVIAPIHGHIGHIGHHGHIAASPAPYIASTPAPLYESGGISYGSPYGPSHIPNVEHYHH